MKVRNIKYLTLLKMSISKIIEILFLRLHNREILRYKHVYREYDVA